MANRPALITLIFTVALSIPEADAGVISDVVSGVTSAVEYVLSSFASIFREIINPPRNCNSSIQYLLYTPGNNGTPCFLEQNEGAIERCPFNSSLPMKFLVHGFISTVHPGGPFMTMKDRLLENYICNVIVVDWRRYNQPPYWLAAVNTQLVGYELANLIKSLEDNAGLDPRNVHLIGHSLGAHVSGVAGKDTPNLQRISGLDAAAPLFSSDSLLHRLTDTDADFVDAIHTSASTIGFGIVEPIGDQDFYPNGGDKQPQCANDTEAEEAMEDGNLNGFFTVDLDTCDHSAATEFYLESVSPAECVFLSAMCDSYEDFEAGGCSGNSSTLLARMGFTARPILGLGTASKFYLRTGPHPPYCLEDGYEPE